MALLETWRKLAYETEMNQNQATEFWNSYFVQEKAIYEQILATPDAPVSGTVKELADKFGVEVLMMTGFLDDCAKVSWGELRKGLLDLVIAVMTAITYVNFNGSDITIALTGQTFALNPVVYGILAVILVWGSINVTNCADGVDGLSGTLASITLATVYLIMQSKDIAPDFAYLILLFIACILGYLWYNATPSCLMMGDAGSRAIGLFIAIAVMKMGSPLLYLLVACVLMVDGGIGLVKVSLLRYLHIKILTKVRTPLHDHVRKNKNWSNAQTVFKFAIIQIMISAAVVWLVV